MSGGVGPTFNDISLPSEKEKPEQDLPLKTHKKAAVSFNLNHLNALTIIIILAASGLVSLQDLAFVIFSIIYIFFLSKVAFPYAKPLKDSKVINSKGKLFFFYLYFTAVIGLFLPIIYILEGIYDGDKEGIKTAAPHLFLLASQVVMEGIAFTDNFAIPIHVFVPVFYNSKRIFTLFDWLRNEMAKEDDGIGGSVRRLQFGRWLALANMGVWCFNLFGFLLPVYLPRAFQKYYSLYNNKVKD